MVEAPKLSKTITQTMDGWTANALVANGQVGLYLDGVMTFAQWRSFSQAVTKEIQRQEKASK